MGTTPSPHADLHERLEQLFGELKSTFAPASAESEASGARRRRRREKRPPGLPRHRPKAIRLLHPRRPRFRRPTIPHSPRRSLKPRERS